MSFFVAPPIDSEIISNELVVVYDYKSKMRHENNKIISNVSDDSNKVNEILEKNHVMHVSDSGIGISESESEETYKRISQFYNTDKVSDIKSTHYYTFSKDQANLKEIINELKKIISVKLVYPSPKLEVATPVATRIGSGNTHYYRYCNNLTGFCNMQGLNDPELPPTIGTDTTNAYFLQHRVYDGLGVYENTTLPKIAIIDSGFDLRSSSIDKPNYVDGVSVRYEPSYNCQPSNPTCNLEISSGLSNAQETCEVFPSPEYISSSCSLDRNGNPFSHGTAVATVAGAPKNNSTSTMGIAPSAPIVAIRARNLHENTIYHSIMAAINRQVDVINISISSEHRPITTNYTMRSAIAAAISANIPVVIAAGNGGLSQDLFPTVQTTPPPCGQSVHTNIFYNIFCYGSYLSFPDVGEIVVGGSTYQVTPNTPFAASLSTHGDMVSLTANATNIRTTTFNPTGSGGNSYTEFMLGTSFATPMVAATVGMMKKITPSNLNSYQLRSLVSYAGNFGRYNFGYSDTSETKYLGANPLRKGTANINISMPSYSTQNYMSMSSIRDLNIYNALILAKNTNSSNGALTRVFNVDDYTKATDGMNWNNYYSLETYNSDELFALQGLYPNVYLDFMTYNSGGGLTHGYQVYRNGAIADEFTGGVVGVAGARNGFSFSPGYWNEVWHYIF